MQDQARLSTVIAASVFPDEDSIVFRRAVSECDLTDTFGAECFCIGHGTPRTRHRHPKCERNLYVTAITGNNPWVGGI